MMSLLVLGKVLASPQGTRNLDYRGTARPGPYYNDALPPAADLNCLFLWHLSISGSGGPVHDRRHLKALREMAEALNRDSAGGGFEIIEAVDPARQPEVGRDFLGIDLSHRLADSWLDGWRSPLGEQRLEKATGAAATLLRVVYRYFEPRLNRYGLFSDLTIATECLAALQALQSLAPGTLEYGEFEPVALYIVEAEETV